MRAIRIGVVEDDPADLRRILNYLDRFQREQGEHFVVSTFDDGEAIVERYTPVYDIVLLDIEMQRMDGMEAARRIREHDESVVIVFITAAAQYAINGYEVQALSYLLKPLPWFAFSQELKRSVGTVRKRADETILVENGVKQIRMELSDIVYIESKRHTIIIHILSGRLPISGTLKEFEEQLAQHDFFRSNSCYLLNLRHVVAVEDQDSIMVNKERLRVSRPRKKAFLAALADYLGEDA